MLGYFSAAANPGRMAAVGERKTGPECPTMGRLLTERDPTLVTTFMPRPIMAVETNNGTRTV